MLLVHWQNTEPINKYSECDSPAGIDVVFYMMVSFYTP